MVLYLNVCVCLCVADVDECQGPGVCGTARCVNEEGTYDCLCETGYVYDNQTKSCLGEFSHTKTPIAKMKKHASTWQYHKLAHNGVS